jgi:hypothetical protein
MKKILISLAAMAALTLTSNAGQIQTLLNGGTNSVGINTTNYYDGIINTNLPITLLTCPFAGRTSVGWSGSANIALTNTTFFLNLDSSVDQIIWQTNAYRVSLLSVGTNQVCTNFDLPQISIPFWRVGSIENTNATASLTNNKVSYFPKTGI